MHKTTTGSIIVLVLCVSAVAGTSGTRVTHGRSPERVGVVKKGEGSYAYADGVIRALSSGATITVGSTVSVGSFPQVVQFGTAKVTFMPLSSYSVDLPSPGYLYQVTLDPGSKAYVCEPTAVKHGSGSGTNSTMSTSKFRLRGHAGGVAGKGTAYLFESNSVMLGYSDTVSVGESAVILFKSDWSPWMNGSTQYEVWYGKSRTMEYFAGGYDLKAEGSVKAADIKKAACYTYSTGSKLP